MSCQAQNTWGECLGKPTDAPVSSLIHVRTRTISRTSAPTTQKYGPNQTSNHPSPYVSALPNTHSRTPFKKPGPDTPSCTHSRTPPGDLFFTPSSTVTYHCIIGLFIGVRPNRVTRLHCICSVAGGTHYSVAYYPAFNRLNRFRIAS